MSVATKATTPEGRREAARADYRTNLADGTRLTGADLAARHGMSERWGRDRIAEVRAATNGHGKPATAPATTNGKASPAPAAPSRNGERLGTKVPTAGMPATTRTARHETPKRPDPGNVSRPASANSAGKVPTAAGKQGDPPATDEVAAGRIQRQITTAAVVIVAAVAAAASYDHQRELADLAGEGWRSLLFPLSVDGLLMAATMLMLTRRQAGQRAGALTWIALTLGITASVAGNVIGADPTIVNPVLVGRLVAAWPPVALFLSLELLMRQLGIHPDRTTQ